MDYAELAFRLKPRNAWEAADLGIRLARHWWWPLTLLWLIVAIPVLIVLVSLSDSITIALLLFWWLKPVYERALLYYLSRAVFNQAPSLTEAVKCAPKLIWQQWFTTLTLRRLSPSRSFDTPVVTLEGLAGNARKQRIDVLHRDKAGSVSFWLTLTGAHVECFIWIGVVATMLALLPESVQLRWDQLLDADYIQGLCAVLSMALVAPFYIAAGFGLYLNRRVVLEGWDLELVFKAMQQRSAHGLVAPKNQVKRSAMTNKMLPALLVVLCTGSGLFHSIVISPVAAEVIPVAEQSTRRSANDAAPLNPLAAREAVEKILQSTNFRQIETQRVPEFIKNWLESENESSADMPEGSWLLALGEQLATIFQLLAWLSVTALLLFVLYYYRDGILSLAGRKRDARIIPSQPDELLNLDIRESSLPEDIGLVATELWQNGKCRDALALLYRASLSRLIYRHQMHLSKGATEGDCLQRVRAMNKPELFGYFQQLTMTWQAMAYAHKPPVDARFNRLCQQWFAVFETGLDGAAEVASLD